MTTHFEYVRVQIVGNEGDWETSYTRSEPFARSVGAEITGMQQLDHDDFLIAEVNGNNLVGLTAAHGDELSDWERSDFENAARGMDLTWAKKRGND